MAALGEASINGVPPFGLPKIRSLVGGIFSPAFSASPLWSIEREQRHAFGFENGLELVDRLVHRMTARNFHETFFFLHGPVPPAPREWNSKYQGGEITCSQ